MLRDEGWDANRKKIQRLWREEGLKVPHRKRKRRRLGTSTCPADRLRAERPNHVWGLDFQFDQTSDGRVLKLLTSSTNTPGKSSAGSSNVASTRTAPLPPSTTSLQGEDKRLS